MNRCKMRLYDFLLVISILHVEVISLEERFPDYAYYVVRFKITEDQASQDVLGIADFLVAISEIFPIGDPLNNMASVCVEFSGDKRYGGTWSFGKHLTINMSKQEAMEIINEIDYRRLIGHAGCSQQGPAGAHNGLISVEERAGSPNHSPREWIGAIESKLTAKSCELFKTKLVACIWVRGYKPVDGFAAFGVVPGGKVRVVERRSFSEMSKLIFERLLEQTRAVYDQCTYRAQDSGTCYFDAKQLCVKNSTIELVGRGEYGSVYCGQNSWRRRICGGGKTVCELECYKLLEKEPCGPDCRRTFKERSYLTEHCNRQWLPCDDATCIPTRTATVVVTGTATATATATTTSTKSVAAETSGRLEIALMAVGATMFLVGGIGSLLFCTRAKRTLTESTSAFGAKKSRRR